MNVKNSSRNWIILLVALVGLCVLVAVGVVLFSSKEPAKTAAGPVATPVLTPAPGAPLPDEFDPVEWTRNPQAANTQAPASKTAAGDQGFTVTLPAEPKAPALAPAVTPVPAVSFPGDTVASAPAGPAPTKAAPKTAATVKASPAKVVAAASAKAAEKTVPKAAKPAAPAYWIQVASFKDRYQAENAAKALETQGLKGTLSTATVNGQSVVRVRVGPYANEAEAAKFLAWLKPVKEFENSYITKAVSTKVP